MSNKIETNLGSLVSNNFRGWPAEDEVAELAPGQFFKLKLNYAADLSCLARQKIFCEAVSYLKKSMERNPALLPSRFSPLGIVDRDGNFHAKSGLGAETQKSLNRFWRKTASILKKGRVDLALPDPEKGNVPEPTIRKEGIGTAIFENLEDLHYLDGIDYPREKPLPGESRGNFIRRSARRCVERRQELYDPSKKKVRESIGGVALSLDRRSNYRMTIRLEKELAAFFCGKKEFHSTEVFAKNGMAPGAVAASANKYSERVTLLRSLESEDGSVDLLSGRVHDFSTAKEMASFAFLSQMNLVLQDKGELAQGITEKRGVYEFRFAIQSLLPMLFGGALGGEEIQMVYKEIAAYRELAKRGIQEVPDPADPTRIYKVRFRPLPVAAVQFNSLARVESLLPQAISGEYDARRQSDQADRVLFALAAEKAKTAESSLRSQIADTVHFLKLKETLKPWEEILTRAYLCHLLRIPLVVHCKSCVDRTNVANAMVTAMKQWIRLGKEIPKIDGKTAIFTLPQVSIPTERGPLFPFKELFAFNLHKGLKITELARGEKGYQYFRGFRQYPALVDLLPARYVKEEKKPSFFKRWIVPIAATILPPLFFQILLSAAASSREELLRIWTPQRKLWSKGLVGKGCAIALTLLGLFPWQILLWLAAFASSFRTKDWRKIAETAALPFKFVKNANRLYPSKTLNEDDPLVGQRRLLAP